MSDILKGGVTYDDFQDLDVLEDDIDGLLTEGLYDLTDEIWENSDISDFPDEFEYRVGQGEVIVDIEDIPDIDSNRQAGRDICETLWGWHRFTLFNQKFTILTIIKLLGFGGERICKERLDRKFDKEYLGYDWEWFKRQDKNKGWPPENYPGGY